MRQRNKSNAAIVAAGQAKRTLDRDQMRIAFQDVETSLCLAANALDQIEPMELFWPSHSLVNERNTLLSEICGPRLRPATPA